MTTGSNSDPDHQEISAREAGRRGGQATSATHGPEHFRHIGRKGGQRTRELYQQLFRQLGQQGGRPQRPE